MQVTQNRKNILILAGAVFALGFALFSQYVQGFHPCEMCIWQRWVYGAVIALVLLNLIIAHPELVSGSHRRDPETSSGYALKIFGILISLTLLAQVALAVFHAGVELKYWEGFSTCSSGMTGGQSIEELRARVMGAPLVRCDEATWFLFGLSMAAWNAIYAAVLFVISLIKCQKSI